MGIEDVMTTDLKKVLNNQYVLDLGCDAGYYTHEYAQLFFFWFANSINHFEWIGKLKEELGCDNVVGVDIS